MANSTALPLAQQIAVDVVVPPIVTALCWLLSTGWVNLVQKGNPTTRTKDWLNKGIWFVLGLFYCVMFGVTAYAYFFPN